MVVVSTAAVSAVAVAPASIAAAFVTTSFSAAFFIPHVGRATLARTPSAGATNSPPSRRAAGLFGPTGGPFGIAAGLCGTSATADGGLRMPNSLLGAMDRMFGATDGLSGENLDRYSCRPQHRQGRDCAAAAAGSSTLVCGSGLVWYARKEKCTLNKEYKKAGGGGQERDAGRGGEGGDSCCCWKSDVVVTVVVTSLKLLNEGGETCRLLTKPRLPRTNEYENTPWLCLG